MVGRNSVRGGQMSDANQLIQTLRELAVPSELPKIRQRLAENEPAFGLRMRDLFDTAKRFAAMDLVHVEQLMAHAAYEPRMTAFCILDFKARRKLNEHQRQELCDFYLSHHDRITTWDMVDRSAPRVVGGALIGGPYDVVLQLAEASEPLRRRSAMTAPLFFVRSGSAVDLTAGFDIAQRLMADPEPVVHNAVGIFLKHAGPRDPNRFREILETGAPRMARSALRLAIAKLSDDERAAYLGKKKAR